MTNPKYNIFKQIRKNVDTLYDFEAYNPDEPLHGVIQQLLDVEASYAVSEDMEYINSRFLLAQFIVKLHYEHNEVEEWIKNLIDETIDLFASILIIDNLA